MQRNIQARVSNMIGLFIHKLINILVLKDLSAISYIAKSKDELIIDAFHTTIKLDCFNLILL